MDLENEIRVINGFNLKQVNEYALLKGYRSKERGKSLMPCNLSKKDAIDWLIKAVSGHMVQKEPKVRARKNKSKTIDVPKNLDSEEEPQVKDSKKVKSKVKSKEKLKKKEPEDEETEEDEESKDEESEVEESNKKEPDDDDEEEDNDNDESDKDDDNESKDSNEVQEKVAKQFSYDDLHVKELDKLEIKDIVENLETQGVTVIDNYIDEITLNSFRKHFRKWQKGCSEPKTGTIVTIGQEIFMYMIRFSVYKMFNNIYGTDDLVSSMEGYTVLPQNTSDDVYVKLHSDDSDGYRSILVLTDQTDGGFVYYKPDYVGADVIFNSKVNSDDITFNRINVKAGSLIIYKPRLAHDVVPSRENTLEYIDISFFPRKELSVSDIVYREKVYACNGTTDFKRLVNKTFNKVGSTNSYYPNRNCCYLKLLCFGVKDDNDRESLIKECEKLTETLTY